jgi:anaerobic selenocysteine-containing dehydrogenase
VYIPIRPGTDAALVLGMINVIVGEGLCDEAFTTKYTVGPFLVRSDNGLFLREGDIIPGDSTNKYIVWDTKTNKPQPYDAPGVMPALRGSYTAKGIECKPAFQLLIELAKQYPLERTSEITEVAPDAIRSLALNYATRRPVVSDKGLGSQRTFHGHLSHRAITTLAAVTGNINIKRPQEDIFGALNWGPFMAPEGRYSPPLPVVEFCDTALMDKPFPVRAMWVSGTNPANSFANRNKFKEIMSRMELIVVVELFMTATAEHADILLPGCTAFESNNLALPYTSYYCGHPYLQLQPKVIEPYYESKSDLEIFTELARRMGLSEFFDKSDEEYIEMLLSSGHPCLEGITLEKLREGPVRLKPYPEPFPLFDTPSGRLEFYVERMKEFGQELPIYIEPLESARQPLAQKYPLSFLQTHSKYREHSTFANVAWMREVQPDPVLEMNPVDAEKRSIQDGDVVIAFNDRGKVKVKARVHEGIKPGVVNVTEGWWPKDFAEGSYQDLTHIILNPAQQAAFQPNAAYYDVLVEVRKAEEG